MRCLLALSLPAVVLLCSCDKGADEPAAKQAELGKADPADTGKADRDASKADSDADRPAESKPKVKPDASAHAPKPKATEARELRRKLLTLLNEGRALTKAGNYTEGMTKYRAALRIDASDVAVLGELGWAAYKSGDLELAHQTTVGALKFVHEGKRRGMLLYNLGRVEEDRKSTDGAIEHYRASLVARPGNKVVQGRLDALLLARAAQPESDPEVAVKLKVEPAAYTPLAALGRDLPDLAAVCELLTKERCEDFAWEEGESCRCEAELDATPGADQSWGLLAFGSEGFPSQMAWFPVVKTDKGWTAFGEVLYEYNPGAFGVFEEVEIGTSTMDPLLAKGSQLVMHVTKSRMDRDMGINEIEGEDHTATIVCARHETGAYCTRALLDSYTYQRDIDFPEEEEEEPIDHDGLPISTGFTALHEFEDGQLAVSWTEKRGLVEVGEMWTANGWVLGDGKYSLAELLGLPSE